MKLTKREYEILDAILSYEIIITDEKINKVGTDGIRRWYNKDELERISGILKREMRKNEAI